MEERLELIWLPQTAPAAAEPRLRVLLPDPPERPQGEGRPVDFSLSVCGDPRCGCLSVRLEAPPEAEGVAAKAGGLPGEAWLDLETKSLMRQPDSTGDPAFERLDQIVGTQLADADRQHLRNWFFDEKIALIYTTPPDEIGITELPEAPASELIGFTDVFPCGLSFYFSFEDESWAVDDQYCVQPGCGCTETVLTFLKIADRSGVPAREISDPPSIWYNYRTHRTKPIPGWPAGGPSRSALLEALTAANPKLAGQLKYRHSMLQALYVRQAIERGDSRSRSRATVRGPRTGRNDPCPCGSGRKFKHCCQNK